MKTLLVLAIAGLAISFALPVFAQEQNTVDHNYTEVIVALAKKFDDAYNNDAAALTRSTRRTALGRRQ